MIAPAEILNPFAHAEQQSVGGYGTLSGNALSPVETAKCAVFIATSLDGFIARKNGDLDWLPHGEEETGGEDFGFNAFYAAIDTLVMGRHTYEKALHFDAWPYAEKRVMVLSRRYPKTPIPLEHNAYGSSLSPDEIVAQLAADGARQIYVDGGQTIQAFLRATLIQEIVITQIPILLGEGIPLFGPLDQDILLKHVSSHAYMNGFVQNRYLIQRNMMRVP